MAEYSRASTSARSAVHHERARIRQLAIRQRGGRETLERLRQLAAGDGDQPVPQPAVLRPPERDLRGLVEHPAHDAVGQAQIVLVGDPAQAALDAQAIGVVVVVEDEILGEQVAQQRDLQDVARQLREAARAHQRIGPPQIDAHALESTCVVRSSDGPGRAGTAVTATSTARAIRIRRARRWRRGTGGAEDTGGALLIGIADPLWLMASTTWRTVSQQRSADSPAVCRASPRLAMPQPPRRRIGAAEQAGARVERGPYADQYGRKNDAKRRSRVARALPVG